MHRIAAFPLVFALTASMAAAQSSSDPSPPEPATEPAPRGQVRMTTAASPDTQFRRWRNNRLGFSAVAMTPELRKHYGAPADRGALITKVEADSPAGKLGLQVGDVVTAVGGERIVDPANLELRLTLASARSALQLEVIRRKKPVILRQERLETRPLGAPRALDRQEREAMIRSLQAEILRLEARTDSLRKRLKSLESEKAGDVPR